MVSFYRPRLPKRAILWLLVLILVAGGDQTAGISAQAKQSSSASDMLVSDYWSPTGEALQEFTPRYDPTAVWTGTEVIFWGGKNSNGLIVNNGARYNPTTNTWRSISTVNAPVLRGDPTAVWTGTEMIIYGGVGGYSPLNAGGRYNPATDTWRSISTVYAPENQGEYSVVWTGKEMIIWGGEGKLNWDTFETLVNTGGRYNPETDTWTPITTINAPTPRMEHSALWTGTEMIVWGGQGGNYNLNTGGRYNPTTNTWTLTSLVNAPQPREFHTAIWTGTEMIVWGGYLTFPYPLNNGGRYNPTTDTWTPVSMTNAPEARVNHTAIWTGETSGSGEMIVWGGVDHIGGGLKLLNSGGRYDPITDTWEDLTTLNAPLARYRHTAIWVQPSWEGAGEMIVWGGYNSGTLNTGGRYGFYDYYNFLPSARK